VTLLSPPNDVFCSGAKPRIPRGVWAAGLKGCNMELAVFVVVLIVAGAVIPGDSKIRFYR
jgi:hypothetical protein